MDESELIQSIATRLDPQVFEYEGLEPPMNFLGSSEWWEVAKNSRRLRAAKDAAAALRAIRQLGLAVVPRAATTEMVEAGAARLVPPDATNGEPEREIREIWDAMLAASGPGAKE